MKPMSEGFMVLDRPCDECLFSPNRIVSGERAAEVIRSCQESGTHFSCHKATIVDADVCCRGFYDRFPNHTPGMRISSMFGLDRFVSLEELEKEGI